MMKIIKVGDRTDLDVERDECVRYICSPSRSSALTGFINEELKTRYKQYLDEDNRDQNGEIERDALIKKFCSLAVQVGQDAEPSASTTWPSNAKELSQDSLYLQIRDRLMTLPNSIGREKLYQQEYYVVCDSQNQISVKRGYLSTYEVFVLVVAALLDDAIYGSISSDEANLADSKSENKRENKRENEDKERKKRVVNEVMECILGKNSPRFPTRQLRDALTSKLSGVYPINLDATDDSKRYWYPIDDQTTSGDQIISAVSSLVNDLVENGSSAKIKAPLDHVSITLRPNQTFTLTLFDYINLVKSNQTSPKSKCVENLTASLKKTVKNWAQKHYLPFDDITFKGRDVLNIYQNFNFTYYKGVNQHTKLEAGLIIPALLKQAECVPLFTTLYNTYCCQATKKEATTWLKEERLAKLGDIIDQVSSWIKKLFENPMLKTTDNHQEINARSTALSQMGWPLDLSEEEMKKRINLLSNFNRVLSLAPVIGCFEQLLKVKEHLGDNFNNNLSTIENDFSKFIAELNSSLGLLPPGREEASIPEEFWHIDLAPLTEKLSVLENVFKSLDPASLFWLTASITKDSLLPAKKAIIDGFSSIVELTNTSFSKESGEHNSTDNQEQKALWFIKDHLASLPANAENILGHLLKEAIKSQKYDVAEFLLNGAFTPPEGILKEQISLDVKPIVEVLAGELHNSIYKISDLILMAINKGLNVDSLHNYLPEKQTYDVLAAVLMRIRQQDGDDMLKAFMGEHSTLFSPESLANIMLRIKNQQPLAPAKKPSIIRLLLLNSDLKLEGSDEKQNHNLEQHDVYKIVDLLLGAINIDSAASTQDTLADVLKWAKDNDSDSLYKVCANMWFHMATDKERRGKIAFFSNALADMKDDYDTIVNTLACVKTDYHISTESFWIDIFENGSSKVSIASLVNRLAKEIKQKEVEGNNKKADAAKTNESNSYVFSDMLASLLVYTAHTYRATKSGQQSKQRTISCLEKLDAVALNATLKRVIELYPEQLSAVLECCLTPTDVALLGKTQYIKSKISIFNTLKALRGNPSYTQKINSAISNIKLKDRSLILKEMNLETPSIAENIKNLFTGLTSSL